MTGLLFFLLGRSFGDKGNIQMDSIHKHEAGASEFDAAHARDRLSWVSKARSLAATTLERQRAGEKSGFYLALPHQLEKPGP